MGSGFESQGAHIKENPADSSESAGFLCSLNFIDFGLRYRYFPLRLQGWGGWVPRASQDYGVRYMFPPRLRRGTRHPDAPLFPCFAAEERPCDTLRALPENVAAPGWAGA